MSNFIPPANGMSQGIYFLPKSHNKAVLKKAYKNSSGSQTCKLLKNVFWFWLDERSNNQNFDLAIDGLNFFWPILFFQSWDNWDQSWPQTDRQILTGVCGFFLSVKFATSLTRFTCRGQCKMKFFYFPETTAYYA